MFCLLVTILVAIGSHSCSGAVKRSVTPSWSLASAPAPLRGSSDELSRKERLEVFEEVWKTVNDRYYDPSFNGVDWAAIRGQYRPLVDRSMTDDEFYGLLARMVGELHDAHTRFHSPRERRERKRSEAVSSGIFIYEVEGKPVVVSVEPDSDAAHTGVEPGMIVTGLDGKPISQRLAELKQRIGGSSSDRAVLLRLYRKLLEGEPGSSFRLSVIGADGSNLDVETTRHVIPDTPKVVYRLLPSGHGYIKFNMWKSPVHEQFKNALQRLKATSGLIIDLRGNPGGEVDEVLKVARYLFHGPISFGRFVTRSGKPLALHTVSDGGQLYGGAVAILINEASASGSEMFAAVMQENGRAVVIGRQSCGCLLGITKYRKVKGGGELSISELGYLSPRGRKLEGVGVIPDRAVELKLADLRARRDAAFETAEDALKETSQPQRAVSHFWGGHASPLAHKPGWAHQHTIKPGEWHR